MFGFFNRKKDNSGENNSGLSRRDFIRKGISVGVVGYLAAKGFGIDNEAKASISHIGPLIDQVYHQDVKPKMSPMIPLKYIDPKIVNQVVDVENRIIDFNKLNPDLSRRLYYYCEKLDVSPKLVFSIALIESNFGMADPRNPLMAEPENIKAYGGNNGVDSPIVAGIMIMKDYAQKLGIDIRFNSTLSYRDSISFISAYNAGFYRFVKDPEKVLTKFKVTRFYYVKFLSVTENYRMKFT